MADREDIGTPTEETASLLDGPPRSEDVAEDITKNMKRVWLIGAGAFLIVSLGAWGVFAAMNGVRNGDEADIAADATKDASDVQTSSYYQPSDGQELDPDLDDDDSQATPDDDDSVTDAGEDAPSTSESFVDAGMIAFRMGDEIWVANEDGTDPRHVTDAPRESAYALSPDGTAIAVVDTDDLMLSLVEIDTGSLVEVGPAAPRGLSWSPDSGWLVFQDDVPVSGGVFRVDRDGTGVSEEGDHAFGPKVIFDGVTLAWIELLSDGGLSSSLAVERTGGPRLETLVAGDWLADFEFWGDGISYVVWDEGVPHIRTGHLATPDIAELVGPPESPGFMVGYGDLSMSPGGDWLAYTMQGDDGYSRLFVVDMAGGTPKELSLRRDAYPLRWSSDGEYLLFIEGNAWHGEDTRLLRVRPDGSGRQTLIEGAGL